MIIMEMMNIPLTDRFKIRKGTEDNSSIFNKY